MTEAISNEKAATRLRVTAVISLLGEPATSNAATRHFRGRPVLAHTVECARRAGRIDEVFVIAWDDQLAAIAAAADDVEVHSCGPRRPGPTLQATTAALRWADGWRGGLLGFTEFDRGFDAAAISAVLRDDAAATALIVSASAALIEPAALDALIDHLERHADHGYAFAPGAPGSGAMLLRRPTLDDLVAQRRGPGSLLAYHPDRPLHDPLAKAYALAVPPRLARTLARLTLDSGRQVRRLAQFDSGGVEAVEALEASRQIDPMPRDVVVELTTRRATSPPWSMLSLGAIERPDLSMAIAEQLFAGIAVADDARVTFGGVGDPLLHPQFESIVELARSAGIRAVHVETDLLPVDPSRIDALAASGVDVVSFALPAAHASTYADLMGVDRMRDVLDNVKRFIAARALRTAGTPILVPTFVKCERNLGEMEAWYDQWIRAVGAAVIVGPSDYGGRLASIGLSDMTPGARGPCRRLRSRITILSDGTVASCEEDVLGDQRCGEAADVHRAWHDGMTLLRSLHEERRWDEAPLCRDCRMWDRP